MKKSKKSVTKRPRGRPRVNYTYEEAKEIIKSEGLTSKTDYMKWWKYNIPARFPKRPDCSYRNNNFSWSDFLGSKNSFPSRRKSYRTYEEAKTFANTLGFTTKAQWIHFAKSDKKPPDIPSRPDIFYQKKGEWHTWREFLGYDLNRKHEELVLTKQSLLYIAQLPNRPTNVFKFGTGIDIIPRLKELANKGQIRIIKIYNLPSINEDWFEKIEQGCNEYFYGEEQEYSVNNIAYVISTLDSFYSNAAL